MEKIVALAKARGFVYPGSEIYGGLANTWDYGNLGVELKYNVKKAWWQKFVQESPYNVGVDCAILMNPQTWVASGHLGGFSDPLMDCKECHERFRADKLIEDFCEENGIAIEGSVDAWSQEEMKNFIEEHNVPCPTCGKHNFTDIRQFNLMFKTFQGVTEDAKNTVYLRPETAQGIFVNFKNVQRTSRKKIPFGIGQIGKSFRNEITPGNFTFRTREFEHKIMEICRTIQDKLKELMSLDISIGVGSWARTQQELRASHELAEKAIEYRYLLGGSLLIDMEEQPEEKNLSIKAYVEKLPAALKAGKKENAEHILEQISSEIKEARVDKSRACVYLQQIIRAADETCEDMVPDNRLFSKREALLQQVTEQNSFDSAVELVRNHIGEIFQTLSDANSSSGQRQARLALDYIQKNYMDPDLSLNSICSYLNISTSYFSTIFKDLTGETFTEVLIRTRMEKAKELLENTTMKNYEIAEKVGFADPHYFGISFKKMTGCTPTEYAREKRK